MGYEPRKIFDNGELAIKNKKIPMEYDVLNKFTIGGINGFSYRGKRY